MKNFKKQASQQVTLSSHSSSCQSQCASWCPAASMEVRGPAQMQELPETSSLCTSAATQISTSGLSMCGFKQDPRELRMRWNPLLRQPRPTPPNHKQHQCLQFFARKAAVLASLAGIPTSGITSQNRTWLHTQASVSSSVSVGPLQIYYSSLKLVIQVELTAGKANLPTQPLRASLTTALRALSPQTAACFISQITSPWRWKTLQLL